MLGRGVDVAVADPYGNTGLHLAARAGFLGAVRMLISSGAELGGRNRAGHSPVDLARARGHHEVASLLEAALESPAALCEISAAGEAARAAVEEEVAAQAAAEKVAASCRGGMMAYGAQDGRLPAVSATLVRERERSGHDALRRPISSARSRPPPAAEWIATELDGLRVLVPRPAAATRGKTN